LQKKGWRVLYYNRTLARGLAPQTFSGFATQWQRWGEGAMQVLRQEKPMRSPELSLAQKVSYFSSFYFYWMSWVKLFFVLTPIFSLVFGQFPLYTDPASYASFFLPYFFVNLACSVLLQGGVRNFFLSEEFNLLKMHVLMKSMGGLFERDKKFKVTPKARAAAARATEVLLPLVLEGFLLASLVAGITRIRMVPLWGYVFWALAVNIAWAIIFLYMIGRVLMRSLRTEEQRSSYRFRAHLDIPMRIVYVDGRGHRVEREHFARNLNRSGVSVTLEEAIVPGTEVEIEMWLPDHTIHASGEVVRNQTYRVDGRLKIANGIRFLHIATSDQDEITKYLFWDVAPRQSELLSLTRESQMEVTV